MSAALPARAWTRAGLGPGFRVDAVVLDVDGVLVDVRDSFREAVRVTVREVQRRRGVPRPWTPAHRDIDALKRARGFNDDIDTAIALAAIGAAGRGREARRLAAAADAAGGGLAGLRRAAPELPGIDGALVLSIFDGAYWGAEGFAAVFGRPAAEAPPGPGLVARERALVPPGWLGELRGGGAERIAVVTGRTPAELDAALALLGWAADELDARVTGDAVRKPDPRCLDAALGGGARRAAVYVGDVRDDWELVRRYREERPRGVPVRCVLVGRGSVLAGDRALGVDATLERAGDLPALLDAWR